MKEYLFSNNELNLIKFLKSNSPKRIWMEPIFFIFEYDDFYIELGIECAEKLNLDFEFEQFAMIATLNKRNQEFKPQLGSELLVENKNITEINIVRTLLFYCQPVKSKPHSNFFNLNSSQINPTLELDKKLKIQQTRIVDVGLWIKLNKKVLNCFIIDNDDDFSINSQCYDNIDLKQTKNEDYSLVEDYEASIKAQKREIKYFIQEMNYEDQQLLRNCF